MANAEVAHAGGHEEHDTTTGLSHKKLLMWAFLGSDCMFFGSFIATYLVYKNSSQIGPFPEDVFDILTTSTSTFVLLMSSMSMVLAYNALTRGNMKGFRIWLLSTCIMGATFLAFQVFEFNEFVNYHVDIDCKHLNIEELTDFEKTFADRCDGTVDHVPVEAGTYAENEPIRHDVLHIDWIPRGTRHDWGHMAAVDLLLFPEEGRHYSEET